MEMFISTAFVPGLALLLDYLFNFIIRRRINISYAFLNYYSTYFSYWFSLINFAMLDRPIVATPKNQRLENLYSVDHWKKYCG